MVVDVSCDYTSANNPLPVYDRATTFQEPTLTIPDIPYVRDTALVFSDPHNFSHISIPPRACCDE